MSRPTITSFAPLRGSFRWICPTTGICRFCPGPLESPASSSAPASTSTPSRPNPPPLDSDRRSKCVNLPHAELFIESTASGAPPRLSFPPFLRSLAVFRVPHEARSHQFGLGAGQPADLVRLAKDQGNRLRHGGYLCRSLGYRHRRAAADQARV